jgi:DNA-binding FadR family transcriptional regulator
VLAAVCQAATGFLAEFHTGLVRLSGAERLTVEEHAAILAAVEARDADLAEARMRAHLTRANALYRVLEGRGEG